MRSLKLRVLSPRDNIMVFDQDDLSPSTYDCVCVFVCVLIKRYTILVVCIYRSVYTVVCMNGVR